MRFRLALVLLAAALAAPAQMKMTVQQLVSFMKSSVDLKQDDKQVAASLKGVTLTERLDDRAIETLLGYGIGPRTAEALRALRDATKTLAPAKLAAEAPKPPPPAPPSAAEQKQVIERAREYALNYSRSLPDFICTQVTRRFYDPTGLEFWRPQDVITTKLSYFEQKEDYKVMLVNDRPTSTPYEKLGGATSAGEFGTMLKELFEPESEAQFQWVRWATLRGRRMHVYSFQVEQSRSKYTVKFEDQPPIVVGYHGQVYIDRDTLSVQRIQLEATGIPSSFPIQQASQVLDYDQAEISGVPFTLPMMSTMRMREGKLLVKNEVEFRRYQKFGTDTSIKFDTPDPLPADKTAEQPPK